MSDCPRCDAFENDILMAKESNHVLRKEMERLQANLEACQHKVRVEVSRRKDTEAELLRMQADRTYVV